MTATADLFGQYVLSTYGRFELCLSRGQGCEVWDEQGRRYLDFGAGIAVTSIGHAHPRMVDALREQAGVLVHTSNLYYTRPQAELAQMLVELTCAPGRPRGKIFFCNSGAEANEALYKLCRKFGNESEGGPRTGIITMLGSFHGRTMAGISATGQEKVKKGFEPLVEGFSHVPFNDEAALRGAAEKPATVAILLEPVQGEIGIVAARPEFLSLARQLCDERNLLLLFDEVQCGLGRTGDWCGWKTLGGDELMPDAVSWAKGIAGGFPMGAVWISDRPVSLANGQQIPLCDLLGPGTHGTTFGGTPLACVTAKAVLGVIEEENLMENARAMGAYAVEALRALQSPYIREVRGVGLMIGIDLASDLAERVDLKGRAPSLALVDRLHEEGMLNVPSGTHAVRWLPPLNVSRIQIDEAVGIFASALAKL